jgi:hypothetical protein
MTGVSGFDIVEAADDWVAWAVVLDGEGSKVNGKPLCGFSLLCDGGRDVWVGSKAGSSSSNNPTSARPAKSGMQAADWIKRTVITADSSRILAGVLWQAAFEPLLGRVQLLDVQGQRGGRLSGDYIAHVIASEAPQDYRVSAAANPCNYGLCKALTWISPQSMDSLKVAQLSLSVVVFSGCLFHDGVSAITLPKSLRKWAAVIASPFRDFITLDDLQEPVGKTLGPNYSRARLLFGLAAFQAAVWAIHFTFHCASNDLAADHIDSFVACLSWVRLLTIDCFSQLNSSFRFTHPVASY